MLAGPFGNKLMSASPILDYAPFVLHRPMRQSSGCQKRSGARRPVVLNEVYSVRQGGTGDLGTKEIRRLPICEGSALHETTVSDGTLRNQAVGKPINNRS